MVLGFSFQCGFQRILASDGLRWLYLFSDMQKPMLRDVNVQFEGFRSRDVLQAVLAVTTILQKKVEG